jgi:diguanylate cyclase (GGDEF)-like protein
VALKALVAEERDAIIGIECLAHSLCESAGRHGFPAVYAAAESLKQADYEGLADQVEALIDILREEAAHVHHPEETCLVIGRDDAFVKILSDELFAFNVVVIGATGASDGLSFLDSRHVSCMIVSARLEDSDAKSFLHDVRGNAATALIPVLVLDDDPPDQSAFSYSNLQDGDRYMAAPFSEVAVADWVWTSVVWMRTRAEPGTHDALTGLLNRAGFLSQLDRALATHDMDTVPICIAAVSIDKPNHEILDIPDSVSRGIVRRVAELFRESFRTADRVARVDGNEFLVLLPGEEVEGGILAIQRVTKQFIKILPELGEEDLNLAISAGVIVASHSKSREEMLDDVDQHLHKARLVDGHHISHARCDHVHAVDHALVVMSASSVEKTLEGLFKGDEFKVTNASSEEELAGILRDGHPYTVIVVDACALGGNGLELISRIRGVRQYDRTPLVFLAAETKLGTADQAREAGASDCIGRPILPFAFMKQVRRLLTHGVRVSVPHVRLLRVLVVDEDIRTLFMAASALTTHGGFRVFLAKGCDDAMVRTADVRPDIMMISPSGNVDGKTAALISGLQQDTQVVAVLDDHDDASEMLLNRIRPLSGIILKPINALTVAEQFTDVLALSESHECAADSAGLLNRELTRIVAMTSPQLLK